MRISVSMIVKNEESCLETCLNSVKDADEIVVVDTGSEDNTVEIAKKFTDKVYFGEEYLWRDDFAFSRNQSLSKCTGDWILIIDADEFLEEGGLSKIRNYLNTLKNNSMHVRIIAKDHPAVVHNSIRVFKNNVGIHWLSRIHNYLSVTDGPITDVAIYTGYSEAHKKDPDRALRILTEVVRDNPSCKRERYYLAREYWYRHDFAKAAEIYEDYLKVGTWYPEIADARLMLARCYWYLREGNKARDNCLQAIRQNPDFKEALLFMSDIHNEPWKSKWKKIANEATNKDVLFVRVAAKSEKGEEKDSSYYDKHFSVDTDFSRYTNIYTKISNIVGEKTLLDVGCGTSELFKFVKNYSGFDFAEKTIEKSKAKGINVWVGNIFDKDNYKEADYYSIVEVLEHVDNDVELLKTLPCGKPIIITVPSFNAPSHVRVYNEALFREKYSDILDIKKVSYFTMMSGKWVEVSSEKEPFILFFECEVKKV